VTIKIKDNESLIVIRPYQAKLRKKEGRKKRMGMHQRGGKKRMKKHEMKSAEMEKNRDKQDRKLKQL
jgi:hypothetical protein